MWTEISDAILIIAEIVFITEFTDGHISAVDVKPDIGDRSQPFSRSQLDDDNEIPDSNLASGNPESTSIRDFETGSTVRIYSSANFVCSDIEIMRNGNESVSMTIYPCKVCRSDFFDLDCLKCHMVADCSFVQICSW